MLTEKKQKELLEMFHDFVNQNYDKYAKSTHTKSKAAKTVQFNKTMFNNCGHTKAELAVLNSCCRILQRKLLFGRQKHNKT